MIKSQQYPVTHFIGSITFIWTLCLDIGIFGVRPFPNKKLEPSLNDNERIFLCVCVCVKSVFNENICAASNRHTHPHPPSQDVNETRPQKSKMCAQMSKDKLYHTAIGKNEWILLALAVNVTGTLYSVSERARKKNTLFQMLLK